MFTDAGPLIALLGSDDKHHRRYDTLITELSATGLRLLTTWPCVVEASHLLPAPQRFELLRWIELGGVVMYPFAPHDLSDMISCMERYTDRRREIDVADASLYWLASETGFREIMTVDVRDFTRYRLPDGEAFAIL